MTPEQYATLLEEQGGGCAICGSSEKKTRNGTELELPVDHCHETGRVRGILCDNCNRAMGLLGDAPTRLLRAVSYLRRSGT